MAGDNVTFFPSKYGDLIWRNVTFVLIKKKATTYGWRQCHFFSLKIWRLNMAKCEFFPQKKGNYVWLATMSLFFPQNLTWRNVTFPPQNMATKYGELLLFFPLKYGD
jgi:hypothetical protein